MEGDVWMCYWLLFCPFPLQNETKKTQGLSQFSRTSSKFRLNTNVKWY
jgi:hypothetical protein